jgi:TetR/AcrR family transcriptional regulator, cholesterol catabolism regulator
VLDMAKIKQQINGTKKDIILKNAAALFRSKGFKATSVRELADTMGIEAPSLYNHIGSKGEILQDICFEVAADYTLFMDDLISTKESALTKATRLIQFHIEKLYNDFDKVYVADHEWKQLPKKQLEEFLLQRKMYETSFVGIVEEGIQKKYFKKLDAKIAVFTILSAVRGLEFLHRTKHAFSLEALQENMVQHLLNGITK